MSYIQDNLLPGEEVLYEGRLSFWGLAKWAVPGFLMVPFIFAKAFWGTTVFLLGVGMMTSALIQFATTEMAVTSRRIIAKRGWIARRTTEINLGRIEGVEVNQTLVQRLLNYGHILVSGVGSHKARITDVSDPIAFRKAFLTALQEFELANGQGLSKGASAELEGHDKRAVEDGREVLQPDLAAHKGHDQGGSIREQLERAVVDVDGELVVIDKPGLLRLIADHHEEMPALLQSVRLDLATLRAALT